MINRITIEPFLTDLSKAQQEELLREIKSVIPCLANIEIDPERNKEVPIVILTEDLVTFADHFPFSKSFSQLSDAIDYLIDPDVKDEQIYFFDSYHQANLPSAFKVKRRYHFKLTEDGDVESETKHAVVIGKEKEPTQQELVNDLFRSMGTRGSPLNLVNLIEFSNKLTDHLLDFSTKAKEYSQHVVLDAIESIGWTATSISLLEEMRKAVADVDITLHGIRYLFNYLPEADFNQRLEFIKATIFNSKEATDSTVALLVGANHPHEVVEVLQLDGSSKWLVQTDAGFVSDRIVHEPQPPFSIDLNLLFESYLLKR